MQQKKYFYLSISVSIWNLKTAFERLILLKISLKTELKLMKHYKIEYELIIIIILEVSSVSAWSSSSKSKPKVPSYNILPGKKWKCYYINEKFALYNNLTTHV